MIKYIDAEKLIALLKQRKKQLAQWTDKEYANQRIDEIDCILDIDIDTLQQVRPMPDSTQLIAEWKKEKAVLEQKDFRGDAERMAYNAFLDGFVKGLGYEGTR